MSIFDTMMKEFGADKLCSMFSHKIKEGLGEYEEEFEKYKKMGIPENLALELVMSHIEKGKKPEKCEPKKEERVQLNNVPVLEKNTKDIQKQEKELRDKYLALYGVPFSPFNLDTFNELDKLTKEFFFDDLKENKKVAEKQEKNNVKLPATFSKELKELLNGELEKGDNLKVISDKPNHIEYEIRNPNGYYKYCEKKQNL